MELKNVQTICTNHASFAALTDEGKMIIWGDQDTRFAEQTEMQNIFMVFSNERAFAAITNEGDVVTYGNADYGANPSTKVQDQLKDVIMIFSTKNAFTALRKNGSVVTWGCQKNDGEVVDEVEEALKKCTAHTIYSSSDHFMARCEDGSNVVWSHECDAKKL